MRLPGTQKSFVMNTMQVFYKTVPAKSSSSFSGCQQEIISSTLGHGHSGTYKTIHEPLSCRQTRMLAETGPRELRRKVMPQLYTDWSESMEYLSKEYQEFVTDRVIHHFNTLLLLWLLRSHHTPHTTLKWRQTWKFNITIVQIEMITVITIITGLPATACPFCNQDIFIHGASTFF